MTTTGPTPADEATVSAMRHALSLASRGPVWGPNPQVGCVLLDSEGRRVAEGWHRGAGSAHAEVDALAKLEEGASAGLTAVVTLEPCNHTGLTGPCTEALIAAGITRVVYAVADPGAASGGGAERLREAGIEVLGGVLADEVEEALHPWLTAVTRERPWVTLKWASTLDGRAAAADGTSQWITGAAARQRVHEQRAASDAIAVGTGTVLSDDPSLTARGDAGELMEHQPVPVIIGERLVPRSSRVMHHPKPAIVTASRDLDAVLAELYGRGIRRLYVEGGPTLASAFIASGLVDEYAIYLGAQLLGSGRSAVADLGVATIGEARRLEITSVEQLGGDLLVSARPASTGRISRNEPAVVSGELDQQYERGDG
ncbi:bifunctional diaminohydroxyphosphoribosylaminopyrimidine deaminase/5-amino-6-(5-phosphoribosylamino)uracil reductase RibD [Salinibacterium sp. SYSU T00001]|uniref:bifunctional diaminohydroxyphosphoribosylaminopyrimidine deaminase/5-amino-6-(5-phosphoribosylamino)uracil reductase RibD n=1 Tax=Homoserinimonas sedimenticola TaxID=2986805 RepID=UPI0022357907|nr:bifunctional diaminohydroxyphosphoribosylaminopyrimidine deaminase/5-amino-6-(5-phosphoribosylamino)uracil reductase RibD [Salinibacterium sedimenticola]MCW4385126.1 bifunctional diaminohydroxyphosphoribosylaminopyrimidine deaminase/5-amino-6-(5-phosphoribosylamino)uracil reductase RibD [Salinibacterium sedimenticola]